MLDKTTKKANILFINAIKNLISYDRLNKNITLIEEIIKFLRKETTFKKGSIINNNDVKDKTLFDLISEKFKVHKYKLVYNILQLLEKYFKYNEEHKAEIFKNFNSEVKKIYDAKIDGDNLLVLISKVLGKKNLVFSSFISIDNKEKLSIIRFVKANFTFIDNILNYNDSEIYQYKFGDTLDEDYKFTLDKFKNEKFHTKIENDCIYLIFYDEKEENDDAMLLNIKIRNNFLKNPVIITDLFKAEIMNYPYNSKKKFSSLSKYEYKFDDLLIYEIPEE